MTVAAEAAGTALDRAAARLARAGIDTARLDARVLLAHALGDALAGVSPTAPLDTAAQARFEALVARRVAREPIAYIVGHKEFWSLRFAVSPAVLIPRPDSETLVEAALRLFPERDRAFRILDLGTGSGCLLLALLHERPRATGLGIDASAAAVAIARTNAAALGLAGRATFQVADWAEPIAGSFDLIVSNPPYVPAGEIATLAPEVRDYEPRGALAGGEDGLDAFRAQAELIPPLLTSDGVALLEVGAGQAELAEKLLIRRDLRAISRARDLAGIERCLALGKTRS